MQSKQLELIELMYVYPRHKNKKSRIAPDMPWIRHDAYDVLHLINLLEVTNFRSDEEVVHERHRFERLVNEEMPAWIRTYLQALTWLSKAAAKPAT